MIASASAPRDRLFGSAVHDEKSLTLPIKEVNLSYPSLLVRELPDPEIGTNRQNSHIN